MKAVKLGAAIALATTLAGCQGGLATRATPVANADDIVKAADWNKMIPVTVELYDYGYEPRDLKLKAGQPYKITFVNRGTKDHYYTAPEFYKAIATRKAMVNKVVEIKAPYFTAFEMLRNGGTIDLYAVPVVKGTYKVLCQIDDHEDRGSTGTVSIE